jgi:hypothetical protein
MSTRADIPRQQALTDANGHPTVPYARFFERLAQSARAASEAASSLVTLPRPEDYGAIGDGVTDDTTAMQAWLANDRGLGWLSANKTYLVQPNTLQPPAGFRAYGPQSATIKASSDAGAVILITANDVHLDGFSIDGGNASATLEAGYSDNHFGVRAVDVESIRLMNLSISNCGYSGIELVTASETTVFGCEVRRCGYIGIACWSGRNVLIDNNKVSDIYPGEVPGNPESNCYGIAVSNYFDGVQSQWVVVSNNYVSGVFWEGIDEHNARFVWIVDNYVDGCGTGIACEHHEVGQPGEKLHILNNTVIGFGSSSSRESVTYRSLGGIVAVGGLTSEQGKGVVIDGNVIENIGDTRVSSGDGGGISLRNWRNFRVSNNNIYLAHKNGIICTDGGSPESNLFGTIAGNTIEDTQTVAAVTRDIYVSGRTAAHVVGNIASGGGNGFTQAGAPTYVTQFNSNYLYS